MIPTPLLNADDMDAVFQQMRSFWVGRGKRVTELEEVMADWVHAKHAVAFGSGRAALMVAIRLLMAETVACFTPVRCNAIDQAISMAAADRGGLQADVRISVYPLRGGEIEDFCKFLPRKHSVTLQGKYGAFSFGALKDVTGGIGGCLVSNEPIKADDWKLLAPISDINAAMILSQLKRYEGHQTHRLVAESKVWEVV